MSHLNTFPSSPLPSQLAFDAPLKALLSSFCYIFFHPTFFGGPHQRAPLWRSVSAFSPCALASSICEGFRDGTSIWSTGCCRPGIGMPRCNISSKWGTSHMTLVNSFSLITLLLLPSWNCLSLSPASIVLVSLLKIVLASVCLWFHQSSFGEEKTYAPPYGTSPTPSGGSPLVPTPVVPTPDVPYTPTPSGGSPVVPTPDVPYTPTPYTPTDPTPASPTPSSPGTCS